MLSRIISIEALPPSFAPLGEGVPAYVLTGSISPPYQPGGSGGTEEEAGPYTAVGVLLFRLRRVRTDLLVTVNCPVEEGGEGRVWHPRLELEIAPGDTRGVAGGYRGFLMEGGMYGDNKEGDGMEGVIMESGVNGDANGVSIDGMKRPSQWDDAIRVLRMVGESLRVLDWGLFSPEDE